MAEWHDLELLKQNAELTMRIFDALPPKLRRIVDDWALGLPLENLYQLYQIFASHGEEIAIRSFYQFAQRQAQAARAAEESARDPLAQALERAQRGAPIAPTPARLRPGRARR